MAKLSFYQACSLLTEAPLPPPAPAGGAAPPGGDLGGDPAAGGAPPGGDPMGGLGGGGMGGLGGGDLGGGAPPPATPVPVMTISIADVWKVLKRVSEDNKYDSFFDEINVSHRNPNIPKVNKSSDVPKSLLK